MKFRYAVIALVGYLLFLIVTAPAAWVSVAIGRFSRHRFGLSDPRGGLWQGRGRFYVMGEGGRPTLLGTLSWHIDPWVLLIGHAEAQVALAGPIAIHALIDRSWGYLSVSNASLIGPASTLRAVDVDARLAVLSGDLDLSVPALVFTPRSAVGSARLVWRRAGTGFSSVNPLGDYRADVKGDGPRLALTLRTTRGALALSGGGWWDAHGIFRFQGTAASTRGDVQINRLVRLLGRPLRPHVRAFVLKARTPAWTTLF